MSNQLTKAVHDFYNDKTVDSLTEKMLVEICAGANEGKHPKRLSSELGIAPNHIKQVVRAAMKYDPNQKKSWGDPSGR